MKLGSGEHDDLIATFERTYRIGGEHARKEPKEMWAKGYIYAHGETNVRFIAYRNGFAYAKCLARLGSLSLAE